jgi:hypothetical protein
MYLPFIFIIYFGGALTLPLEPLHQPFFMMGFFEMGGRVS